MRVLIIPVFNATAAKHRAALGGEAVRPGLAEAARAARQYNPLSPSNTLLTNNP